jgi:hypothetical protein
LFGGVGTPCLITSQRLIGPGRERQSASSESIRPIAENVSPPWNSQARGTAPTGERSDTSRRSRRRGSIGFASGKTASTFAPHVADVRTLVPLQNAGRVIDAPLAAPAEAVSHGIPPHKLSGVPSVRLVRRGDVWVEWYVTQTALNDSPDGLSAFPADTESGLEKVIRHNRHSVRNVPQLPL